MFTEHVVAVVSVLAALAAAFAITVNVNRNVMRQVADEQFAPTVCLTV